MIAKSSANHRHIIIVQTILRPQDQTVLIALPLENEMKPIARMLAAATAIAMASCGGGGGGSGGGPQPMPTPTPTPTPTPSGLVPVEVFPGVTVDTEFASLGIETSGNPNQPFTTTGFSVRYDADSDLYIFDLPTHSPGAFHENASNPESDSYWAGGLVNSSQPGTAWPPMAVLKPSTENPEIQLSYTSLAAYEQAGPMENRPHGFVAFGMATPNGAVPLSGSATYNALVRGASLDQLYFVAGSGTLQFNFASGTLTGHFDPTLSGFYSTETFELGRYDFVNTIYGVGSTSFSGQLSNASVPGLGSFNGLFTGPSAEELMASWQAPFVNPETQQVSQIYGVWVAGQ